MNAPFDLGGSKILSVTDKGQWRSDDVTTMRPLCPESDQIPQRELNLRRESARPTDRRFKLERSRARTASVAPRCPRLDNHRWRRVRYLDLVVFVLSDRAVKNREAGCQQTSSNDAHGQILHNRKAEGGDQH
jgi:hypothetical protein